MPPFGQLSIVRWRAHPFGDGSQQWWAHLAFTRINIDAPRILRKEIEDARDHEAPVNQRARR